MEKNKKTLEKELLENPWKIIAIVFLLCLCVIAIVYTVFDRSYETIVDNQNNSVLDDEFVPRIEDGQIIKERIGGDEDEHGCLVAAGYSWCEMKNKCLRIWEEKCDFESSGAGEIACTQEMKQCPDGSFVGSGPDCKFDPCPNELFCGGISGKSCPQGYDCRLDGSYPDASGKCVEIMEK
jgi:hypothetical protein